MHKGAQKVLAPGDAPQPYTRRQIFIDVGVSLLYTILVLLLVKPGVLKPVTDYGQNEEPAA
jgi:hypothetical protein